MEVAVAHRLDRSLSDVTVAVQGLGRVGFAICEMLHAIGARLIIAERNAEVAAHAAIRFGAEIASAASVAEAKADVFAPCSMDLAMSRRLNARLKAKVVCGAAENQFGNDELENGLAGMGVLHAPDYLVNAGRMISVAGGYHGWCENNVSSRVNAIGDRLADILALAEQRGLTARAAAQERAVGLIAAGAVAPSRIAAAAQKDFVRDETWSMGAQPN